MSKTTDNRYQTPWEGVPLANRADGSRYLTPEQRTALLTPTPRTLRKSSRQLQTREILRPIPAADGSRLRASRQATEKPRTHSRANTSECISYMPGRAPIIFRAPRSYTPTDDTEATVDRMNALDRHIVIKSGDIASSQADYD